MGSEVVVAWSVANSGVGDHGGRRRWYGEEFAWVKSVWGDVEVVGEVW